MKKIDRLRSRLSTPTGAKKTPRSSPAEDLAACRALQGRLRELKLEVLGQLAALRSAAYEKAQKSLGRKPSAQELSERRAAGAKKLLRDVGQQVMGLLDDKGGAAVSRWSEINQEIDAHLGRLAELEQRLARTAGEKAASSLRAPGRPAEVGGDAGDDELYAAVGAAVLQGQSPGAFCSDCGRGVDPGDRFCRHCGHRRP